jgi:hypothetical protein
LSDIPAPDRDDDLVALIEQTRTWMTANAARAVGRRQAERRGPDRRAPAFASRRGMDTERNHQRRGFLFSCLRQLPEETLWIWIDGLWLGQATQPQIAALMHAATETMAAEATNAARPARRGGRPRADPILPDVHPLLNASIRFEWQELTAQLTALSGARREHHAAMNRTRAGFPRSLTFRDRILASPIGQRVERAGLFAQWFDKTLLTPPIPNAVEARRRHREKRQQLERLEQWTRAKAARAPGAGDRKDLLARAAEIAARRKNFPGWRTVFDKLKAPPPPPRRRRRRGPD